MTAQVFNLAIERPIRTLAKALAQAEAGVETVKGELDQLQGRLELLDDRHIDPRALALLKALQRQFAGSGPLIAELAYLKQLLRHLSRTDSQ